MDTQQQTDDWWWEHNPSNPDSPNYDPQAVRQCEQIKSELEQNG